MDHSKIRNVIKSQLRLLMYAVVKGENLRTLKFESAAVAVLAALKDEKSAWQPERPLSPSL